MTEITDWTDRTTCVLVGDGAGAAVVEAADTPGIGPVVWGSLPRMGHAVRIEGTPPRFAQEGQSVYRWATTQLPAHRPPRLRTRRLTPEDLAAVVLHQANLRIIEPVAQKIGAVNAVIARDVTESGNTSAASIPMALSKLVARGVTSPPAPPPSSSASAATSPTPARSSTSPDAYVSSPSPSARKGPDHGIYG